MAAYLIRVAGRLSARLLDAFPTMHAQVEPVQTTLVGSLPDQGALTGVLNHLDELGVEIVEVVLMPDADSGSAAPPPGRPAAGSVVDRIGGGLTETDAVAPSDPSC